MKNESETGSQRIEWLVLLDHAYNIIRILAEREGSGFVRTFIEGVLEEVDEEESDTTT